MSARIDEPVWVVGYKTGAGSGIGGGEFAWFPSEALDQAIAIYDDMVAGSPHEDKGRSLTTIYFVEYHPATPYSPDPKVREKITEEIEAEIWAVLPDDRPEA